MRELIKPWDDGGSLSVAYDGDGDGEAIFSSDSYEGIDREQSVVFRDAGKSVAVERNVRQEGTRQRFITSDGKIFCVSTGGRFGVLKEGGIEPEPPEPPTQETYTRLAYITSTGVQHLEVDYNLMPTDSVEVLYERGERLSSDQFLFGSPNTWVSTYNLAAYARFGHSASASVSNGYYRSKVKLSKGKAEWDGGDLTTTLEYTDLAEGGINVFSGKSSSGSAYNRGSFSIFYFRVLGEDGNVIIDLVPTKRDRDGKLGMLDLKSGEFYVNVDDGEDFLAGGEMKMGDEYERIDRVTFNNDKGFDTGFYGNETTYIDVMFQRTDTSGADYLFGCSSGNRLTGYLTSSGYWRYGTAYPTFNTNNKKILIANVTPKGTDINEYSRTFTATAFTTGFTIPLGGHKGSAGTITKTFQGYVYYFRMRHGEELLSDWYPCRRLSDGVEGFWDCVTQTFFESV